MDNPFLVGQERPEEMRGEKEQWDQVTVRKLAILERKTLGHRCNFLSKLIRLKQSLPILEHTGANEETERKQK